MNSVKIINNKESYATHKNDVNRISNSFRIRLKPNANLQSQRPTKVPIHCREKPNSFSDELEKNGYIRQIGITPHENLTFGTTFLNPFFIIRKNDSIKIALDARHLNSNTDQFSESCPLEPFATQLARAV